MPAMMTLVIGVMGLPLGRAAMAISIIPQGVGGVQSIRRRTWSHVGRAGVITGSKILSQNPQLARASSAI